jgi:hypothetical protein
MGTLPHMGSDQEPPELPVCDKMLMLSDRTLAYTAIVINRVPL